MEVLERVFRLFGGGYFHEVPESVVGPNGATGGWGRDFSAFDWLVEEGSECFLDYGCGCVCVVDSNSFFPYGGP